VRHKKEAGGLNKAPGTDMSVGIRKGVYVQYGGGLCAPAGWLNFDASARLRLERMTLSRTLVGKTVGTIFPQNVLRGDIVYGLPVRDNSAVAVYSSHCLEHLPRSDIPRALNNTFRMLEDGGVFRLIVPDLQWRALRYVAELTNGSMPADEFLNACHLGQRVRPKTWLNFIIERYKRSYHLWMYDFPTLRELLESAGFSRIRRCQFGDAADPMFAQVEDANRFVDQGHEELAIEAIKAA
jgi:SAM-dependent methyltransferase